jgi:hypothetical protein
LPSTPTDASSFESGKKSDGQNLRIAVARERSWRIGVAIVQQQHQNCQTG